jgi:hypothetical protein
MDPGEQTTGTRDEHYNLISVLYHALHGAETIEAYILDAEAAGDERLAEFFREVQATQRQLAERAKGLLGIGGNVTPGAAGGGTEAPEGIVGPEAPSPGAVPRGEAPPQTAGSGWETSPPRPRMDTGEDATPERAVPPDAPRTEEPPPRTGDAPPSPSEQPPPRR